MNRIELEKLHTQLMGMSLIAATNPFYWIIVTLTLLSVMCFFVGILWYIDFVFGSALLKGVAQLNFTQAGILVISPIFSMLVAIEVMRIIVRLRVLRFLRKEEPEIRMLKRLLDARLISGLSVATNYAIEEYLSEQNTQESV